MSALQSGYGKIRVLHGVDLPIAAGEVVALLGPNGAGKTTLLRALSGLLPVNAGHVRFDGRDITNATPREAARAGLVHVIEGHRVFTQISVTDNLLLAGYDLPRGERARGSRRRCRSFRRSPKSATSAAARSRGGQQQMLTVAQGLVRRPRLLMLDEPSAGLSPVLVDRVLNVIGQLRSAGHRGAAGRATAGKSAAPPPTASMRWCRAISCWRRRPAKTICRNGSSAPISAMRATR